MNERQRRILLPALRVIQPQVSGFVASTACDQAPGGEMRYGIYWRLRLQRNAVVLIDHQLIAPGGRADGGSVFGFS